MNTEATRKIDKEGRIAIPSDMRTFIGFDTGDEVNITIEADALVIRAHAPKCVLCDGTDQIAGKINKKPLCQKCIDILVDFKNKEKN